MSASQPFEEDVTSMEGAQPVQDVGVLFVHGIGRHEAGTTLHHMGGALAAYAQQRFAGDPNIRVDAVATEAVGVSQGMILLSFRTTEGPITTWRLSEARWDGAFNEATLGEVVRWGLLVAPWVLHREAFRWWTRRDTLGLRQFLKRSMWSSATYLLRFLGFTLAAMVLQVLILVGCAFAWIRPVRRILEAILVRTIGDAYRFISDPEALAAMSTLVAGELHRLSALCRKVIVVAHSQGAAVARAAIALRGPPPNLDKVVTLGAGLTKLLALQQLRHRSEFLTYNHAPPACYLVRVYDCRSRRVVLRHPRRHCTKVVPD